MTSNPEIVRDVASARVRRHRRQAAARIARILILLASFAGVLLQLAVAVERGSWVTGATAPVIGLLGLATEQVVAWWFR